MLKYNTNNINNIHNKYLLILAQKVDTEKRKNAQATLYIFLAGTHAT
jgi:hypothetical protein